MNYMNFTQMKLRNTCSGYDASDNYLARYVNLPRDGLRTCDRDRAQHGYNSLDWKLMHI